MITVIRDRLREQLVPDPLRMVEGAAEWAALKEPPPSARRPCAYVIPATLQPGPNILATGIRQKLTQTTAVLICTSNLRDVRGEAAIADIDALLLAVVGALLGWKPTDQDTPLLLGPGALRSAQEGLIVWQQLFTSDSYLTRT